MKRILSYFLQGLIFTVPGVVTVYVCYQVFVRIDRWLGLAVPGVGFAITLTAITLIGMLGSNLLTRSVLGRLESLLERLPFVRLLYSSTKELMNAFVGEKRRFDQPVLVAIMPGIDIRQLGFVTQASLMKLGESEHVAVYCPHSYNFSGQLWIVPRERVTPVDAASSEFMAFVLSGGVTDTPNLAPR